MSRCGAFAARNLAKRDSFFRMTDSEIVKLQEKLADNLKSQRMCGKNIMEVWISKDAQKNDRKMWIKQVFEEDIHGLST